MPITVKHGEGLEGLASLVALMAGAGQQGVPRVPQTGNFISYAGGGVGGGGGGGRLGGRRRLQGQVAPPGEPTEEEQLRIEMQMRLKEQQFGIPIEEERMQMEQEMKANGWKLEYTAESRKRIAKANDGLRIVEERERAGLINPKEAEAMRQALNQELVGTPEAWMPPDPNTPIFEPGKGIGDQWTDEEGNRVTRNEKGITQVQVSFDKTQAGLQMKQEATRENDIRKQMIDYRKELAKEKVETADGKERPLNLGEISARMSVVFPNEMQAEWEAARQAEGQAITQPQVGEPGVDEQMEQELQRRVDTEQRAGGQEGIEKLQTWMQRMGTKPTKADIDLPDEVAMAQAFLRDVNKRVKRGDNIFPHVSEAYDIALEILEGYNARGNR